MDRLQHRRDRALAAIIAALALMLGLGAGATSAVAAPAARGGSGDAASECAGRGVPLNKISVQLWTFADYVGFGGDEASQARLEEVLRRLSEMGYRNVEPFTLQGFTAEEFRALLDEYGLKASARHNNAGVGTPEAPGDVEAAIAENRVLGVRYWGVAGTPQNYTTAAQWEAYAAYLDEVGALARQSGQRLMVHTHNWEFTQTFDGRTAFDILVANTDPKNVVFQLDLYWAVFAGQDPVDLVERYGERIELFHVKDLNEGLGDRIEIVGSGDIDFPRIFAATQGPARYYTVEHDPRFGDPTFDPFVAAQEGLDYLTCVTY